MNYKLCFFAWALDLFYYVPNLLASPIIGGQEDTFHTYKYHVSVQHKFDPTDLNSAEHFCGGAIIHDTYILSAAHPFLRMKNGVFIRVINPRSNGIVVLSGTSETHGSGIITLVDNIFIPHEYHGESPVIGDISVLKLNSILGVTSNRDRLKILPMEQGTHTLEFYVGENAVVLGNGCDTMDNGYPVLRAADRRQFLEVHMTPRDKCPEFNYVICAVNLDNSRIRTVCNGDSGSPIVFDNTIIGVISRGPKRCNERTPIKSTRTSRFINFIQNAMNEHGDHSQMYIL